MKQNQFIIYLEDIYQNLQAMQQEMIEKSQIFNECKEDKIFDKLIMKISNLNNFINKKRYEYIKELEY